MRMKKLSIEEREELLRELLVKLHRGVIHEGDLLRKLRKEMLGMDQEGYASLIGISRRTLSAIERNTATPSMKTVDQVFRPFGLKMRLTPLNLGLQKQVVDQLVDNEWE